MRTSFPVERSQHLRINPYVLAICGPGGAGKDEAARYLSTISYLRYTHSTSYAALDYVYSRIGAAYSTKEVCYNARAENRVVWAILIDEYNKENPTRLYEEHLSAGSDFLVGIRKKCEFDACRRRKLFDLSIWIGRDIPYDPTLEYSSDHCDIYIMNTQDLAHFHYKLNRLADALCITLPKCTSSKSPTVQQESTLKTVC